MTTPNIDNSGKSNVCTMTDNINNILQLNDDCLLRIMENLEPIDLCAIAETCTRLKYIAEEAFIYQNRSYIIPKINIKFEDHKRILENFGRLVTAATCIRINICGIVMNERQMISAFQWMEQYCSESLQRINIVGIETIDLPPSAMRLMSKLQRIDLTVPLSDQMVRNTLWNCNELVELNLFLHDGPFCLQDHRFPQLRKLSNRMRLDRGTDFDEIETFFRHHTRLTDLSTQFLNYHGGRAIDFAFLKHLPDLEKLTFILVGAQIEGIEAFASLKNLKEFSIDPSSEKRTDALIFENLASVNTLVKLVLSFPDVSHLVSGMGRFKELSKVEISSHGLDDFEDANISSLAHLCNNSLTELKISCIKLLKPKSILNVVRNLTKLKIMTLCCEAMLTERICLSLVNICSSQVRKLVIILDKDVVDSMYFDFNFIEMFNKKHGSWVEVKIQRFPLTLNDSE